MFERIQAPPERALLLFDGDCGFCRWCVELLRRRTGDRVDYAPAEPAGRRFPEIPPEQFRRSVVFVRPDGGASAGAEAVFEALATAPGRAGLLSLYRRRPLFARTAEWGYGVVARHRVLFSRLTRPLR